MKKHKFSAYEKYLITADKSGLRPTYSSFLEFNTVVSFIRQIVSKNGDTFLHEGNIYNKKITSNEANDFIKKLENNRCDVNVLRKVATQLKIRV